MTTSPRQDAVAQAIQACPSIAVVIASWFDAQPEAWLTRAGIAFLILQAAYLAWRWHRDVKREGRGEPPHDP